MQVHDYDDLQLVRKNQRELVWKVMVLTAYQSIENNVALMYLDL